jgi:hypothetical protein
MPDPETRVVDPAHIRALRVGHGANCSSIGSVVDTLFVTALLGGAVFAAVMAGLATEKVEVIPTPKAPRRDDHDDAKLDGPAA